MNMLTWLYNDTHHITDSSAVGASIRCQCPLFIKPQIGLYDKYSQHNHMDKHT